MHTVLKNSGFTNNYIAKLLALSLTAIVVIGVTFSLSARAEGATIAVTATNAQGWYSGDTTDGGAVSYFSDPTSPFPSGVLALTTNDTPGAKAQYLKDVNTPLSQVSDLSYYTKHVSGPAGAAVSYQLNIELHGIADWTTSFVFDPAANGQVVPGTWQKWDVYQGRLWASDNVFPIVVAGNGADPYYTLDQLKAVYPNANVRSIGVYAGTFNPGFNVGTSKQNLNLETDAVTFNGQTYDFQAPAPTPTGATSKDQCKNGGWMSFQGAYTNQGQCVSSIVSAK